MVRVDLAAVDLFSSQKMIHRPLWFCQTHLAPIELDTTVQVWLRLRLLQGILKRVHLI